MQSWQIFNLGLMALIVLVAKMALYDPLCLTWADGFECRGKWGWNAKWDIEKYISHGGQNDAFIFIGRIAGGVLIWDLGWKCVCVNGLYAFFKPGWGDFLSENGPQNI